MAPSITNGAVISSQRRPATNVSVFQVPNGTRPINRSPRGQRPYRRAMLVFTDFSSTKTRQEESSRPCSRIQRRRARATSARFCSAARRLFFKGDVVALERTPKRAAAAGNPPLPHCNDELVERPVRLFIDQSEYPFRVVLQRGPAPAARLGRTDSVLPPRLQPSDRRTDADIKAFRRLTSRRSHLNRFDHPFPQIRRIRYGHGAPPKAESHAKTLPIPGLWESPDSKPPGPALDTAAASPSRMLPSVAARSIRPSDARLRQTIR